LSARARAELLLLSVTIIWGSTFVVTKGMIDEISPLWYTAIRFLLAALILASIFPRRIAGTRLSAIKRGTVLGVLLFVGFALQTIGIQFTTASKSAFFTGLLVVLTPIVHVLAQRFLHLPRKTLRIGNVVGVICAAVGLYLLTSPEGSRFNIGDALTIICAIMFALYIVYLDAVGDEPDKMQMTFAMFIVCGLLGVVSAALWEPFTIPSSGSFIASVLCLTVFATVVAMGVQNRFQPDTTPTRAAVIFAMEPVVAGFFAYLVRGEEIGVVGALGGAVMLIGLLLSETSEAIPGLRREIALADSGQGAAAID
jgi:drug/metabolite transporter (DMT)-like permease